VSLAWDIAYSANPTDAQSQGLADPMTRSRDVVIMISYTVRCILYAKDPCRRWIKSRR